MSISKAASAPWALNQGDDVPVVVAARHASTLARDLPDARPHTGGKDCAPIYRPKTPSKC